MANHQIGTTENKHPFNTASYFVRPSTTIKGDLSEDHRQVFLALETTGNYLTIHLAPSSLTRLIDALVSIRRELGLNDDDPTEESPLEAPCPPSVPA